MKNLRLIAKRHNLSILSKLKEYIFKLEEINKQHDVELYAGFRIIMNHEGFKWIVDYPEPTVITKEKYTCRYMYHFTVQQSHLILFDDYGEVGSYQHGLYCNIKNRKTRYFWKDEILK